MIHTNLLDVTSLVPSGRLQNATEYCIKVRKSGPANKESSIRSLFYLESPDFTRTSKATNDMTSPATSGRRLS